MLYLRVLLLPFIFYSALIWATPPALELVDVYPDGLDLEQFWVSEKYDGVRGYWDGQTLWTRGGQRIHAPVWFTKNWPDTALDGELWVGYQQFSQASSIVRARQASDQDWQMIRYKIFDLPEHPGDFNQRIPALKKIVSRINQPWVHAVKQFRVKDERQLYATLDAIVAKGGEGLVLHRGDTPYKAGRGVGLYKLKPYLDAEAKVIGYKPGKGLLTGMVGSLHVQTPDGRTFYIGSGLSDEQRQNPPAIGAWVTYRYNGYTVNGLPRFARFLHERPGGPPPG